MWVHSSWFVGVHTCAACCFPSVCSSPVLPLKNATVGRRKKVSQTEEEVNTDCGEGSNKNSDRIYSGYTWEHFTVNHRLLVMTLSQQLTVSQNFGCLANLITPQRGPDDVCAAKNESLAVYRVLRWEEVVICSENGSF